MRPQLITMTAPLILVMAIATQATGQNTSSEAGLSIRMIEGRAGEVAEISHSNPIASPMHATPGETFYEFDTAIGVVVLLLNVTLNSPCPERCPDVLTVWELPEGIVASRDAVATPEGQTETITLYRYEGV